jgi:hypothetical protein
MVVDSNVIEKATDESASSREDILKNCRTRSEKKQAQCV